MKFGHFDDVNKEYVITTVETPYPWINYLGTDDFFSLISNTAGGYAFYKDARLRRITRYRYNNVPIDFGGRYFYINDGGECWSPGQRPMKTKLDRYECRHGLGYTRITGAKNGVEASALFFVPLNYRGEIQKLTLKNTGSEKKSLKLFSFMEFAFWNAATDMENFQRNFSTGEVEVKGSTIYHKTEYRERRDHYAFYTVNAKIQGYDVQRDSFLGLYNGFDSPQAVSNGKAGMSDSPGWSPIASHYIEVELKPGEEKDFVFILGYVENEKDKKWESKGIINKTKAEAMIKEFDSSEKVDAAFDKFSKHWESLLGLYSVKTGDEKLDRMVNIWNPYQCMVTFNMSRSASYFESGVGRGMGFRDSNQDILGFVHQIPSKARERIMDIAATQLEDGGAYHQYQPLTKKGNNAIGSNFNDDPLWLIMAVAAYIKETGDYEFLKEQVPFENDESKSASMFEHIKRSFYHVVNNLGPHNLPLIGRADWNDCLNLNCFSTEPDESFQTTTNKEGKSAESVMIAGMFVYTGKDFVELCKLTGKEDEAEEAQKHLNDMEKAILENGWDGEWFLRAYNDAGEKVGSKENTEGKIFIESQGFTVMGGVGVNSGEAEKALNSVEKHLSTDYGIVLVQPPFSQYYLNLGEISSYPEGHKENASIFCHNNPWIICAETVIGNGERAMDYYKKYTPAFLEDISEVHKTEPYVYSQTVNGKDAPKPGEAKNSWLTGTAAWSFVAVSQWILGVRPYYNGLAIDPCIPKEWKGFKVSRKFRNAVYNIEISNPDSVSKGVVEMVVDGERLEGNIVPLFEDGEHEVKVRLG